MILILKIAAGVFIGLLAWRFRVALTIILFYLSCLVGILILVAYFKPELLTLQFLGLCLGMCILGALWIFGAVKFEELKDKAFTRGLPVSSAPRELGREQSGQNRIASGRYRFKLPPARALLNSWARVQSQSHGDRICAIFEDGSALTIVESPNHAHDGETFRYRISNVPLERAGENVFLSDMHLLLHALGTVAGPLTNSAYTQLLLKHAEHEFTAHVDVSWHCIRDREIYADDGTGTARKVEGKLGCGRKYWEYEVAKVARDPADPASPEVYPLRFRCSECGATLLALPSLSGFSA